MQNIVEKRCLFEITRPAGSNTLARICIQALGCSFKGDCAFVLIRCLTNSIHLASSQSPRALEAHQMKFCRPMHWSGCHRRKPCSIARSKGEKWLGRATMTFGWQNRHGPQSERASLARSQPLDNFASAATPAQVEQPTGVLRSGRPEAHEYSCSLTDCVLLLWCMAGTLLAGLILHSPCL